MGTSCVRRMSLECEKVRESERAWDGIAAPDGSLRKVGQVGKDWVLRMRRMASERAEVICSPYER